jgi:hypothetical protein
MSTTTSKPLKPKRGTTAQNNGYTGEAYEVTLDTDKKTLVVHDGLTAGGFPLARADEVAAKDAAQDAAIAEAQSSADEKALSFEVDGLDLVITYGNGTTKRVKLPTGKGVGDLWLGHDQKSVPANVQLYSGQLLSRSAYEAHSALVLGGKRTVVTESEWQSYASAHDGMCPYYSSGDGSTTYRMPCIKGVHPKFVAALAEAGKYVEAGAPEIDGSLGLRVSSLNDHTGAFGGSKQNEYSSGWASGTGFKGAIFGQTEINFYASRSSPVYGNSDTIQPPALTFLLGEYVVGSVAIVGEADAESLLASITHLEATAGTVKSVNGVSADAAGNVSISVSDISSISNGKKQGYIKYANGVLINWNTASASSEQVTCTWLTPFVDVNYLPVATNTVASTTQNWNPYVVSQTTTTCVYTTRIGNRASSANLFAIGRWK